jgi:hypothetical protein
MTISRFPVGNLLVPSAAFLGGLGLQTSGISSESVKSLQSPLIFTQALLVSYQGAAARLRHFCPSLREFLSQTFQVRKDRGMSKSGIFQRVPQAFHCSAGDYYFRQPALTWRLLGCLCAGHVLNLPEDNEPASLRRHSAIDMRRLKLRRLDHE